MKNSYPQKWIENFFLLFSAKIEVEINLDSFTFKKDDKSKRFNTFVYVSKDLKNPRIISVGETPIEQIDSLKINLFENNNRENHYSDKYDYLSAFLMHGLKTLTSKYAMVKPSIYLTGVDNLEPVLNGYQKRVLIYSFSDAGAARVIIND
jgi:hypothetical protein